MKTAAPKAAYTIALRCSCAKPPTRAPRPSAIAAQGDAGHFDVEAVLVRRAPRDVQGRDRDRDVERAQPVQRIDDLREAERVELEFDRVLLQSAGDGFLG